MMKESQRQNRMRRSSLMPDKDGKQNDSGANERGLHQSDLSLTEIDKCPHQATAAGAGQSGRTEHNGKLSGTGSERCQDFRCQLQIRSDR